MTEKELDDAIKDAMYRGDMDRLYQLAPCSCCCHEHYALNCPAHKWFGCRGSFSPDRDRAITEVPPWNLRSTDKNTP